MTERHRWSDPVTILENTPSGCEETERTCELCDLVKITVHPPHGFPYRAWRGREGTRTDKIEHTPPCRPKVIEGVACDAAPAEVPFT